MAQNTPEDKEISDLDSDETKKSCKCAELISVGASNDRLTSYIHCRLKEKNLQEAPPIDSDLERFRQFLKRRGEVYEEALKIARPINNQRSEAEMEEAKRIEEFVLKEFVKPDLEKYKEAEPHWKRIECWAVSNGLVNLVVAAIHQGRDVDPTAGLRALAIAAEDDKNVSLINTLKVIAVADKQFEIPDFDTSKEPLSNEENRKLFYNEDEEHHARTVCSLNSDHKFWLCPIEAAARMGHVRMVEALIALREAMKLEGKKLDRETDYRRAFDWAVKMGRDEVVKYLIENNHIVDLNETRIVNGLLDNADEKTYGRYQTPLALAVLSGHFKVVQVLCEAEKGGLKADVESDKGKNPLQMAFEAESHRQRASRSSSEPYEAKPRDKIVRIIMEKAEIQREVARLTEERKVHVDAINAILVGTALIATATFAGWLSPPLGYSPPPGTDGLAFASVEGHPILEKFWIFNSLSFFFSIATFMVGANAARPPNQDDYIGEVVESLRSLLRLAYGLLTVAVAFVVGAFASAGFAVLPPIPKYTVNMAVTVGIGVTVVVLSTMLAMWIKKFKQFKDAVYDYLEANISLNCSKTK